MTTTYVRLKNRRGNRENLPQPLAEGEIGLATDTRELFIGAGPQDFKNRMVQIDSGINAEALTQSLIDTRLVMFKIAETQVFIGDGANVSATVLNGGTPLTVSNDKLAQTGGSLGSQDIIVTKFDISQQPTLVESSKYTAYDQNNDLIIDFLPTAIPEQNSMVVVTMFSTADIKDAYLTEFADNFETGANITEKIAKVTVATDSVTGEVTYTGQSGKIHRLYVDETTGTGFVDIGQNTASTDFATTEASLSSLVEIANAGNNANTNSRIRGNVIKGSTQLFPSEADASILVPGTLLVKTDSPQQAMILSKFLNQALGTLQSTIASNIKIFTQDSKPSLTSNQLIPENGLIKPTLNAGAVNDVVTTFSLETENTVIIDYSLRIGSVYAVGTIKIICDPDPTATDLPAIVDDRLETDNTSAVVFSADIDRGIKTFTLKYTNTGANATMSYTLKRWLTS